MQKKILIFLFSAALILFAANTYIQPHGENKMIARWEHAKSYTMDYLDSMPAESYNFKPTPEMRSFAQQYLHIADVNYKFLGIATGFAHPFPGDSIERMAGNQTKEAVIDITMNSYDAMIDVLRKMSEEELEQSVKFFGSEMSKEDVLFKAYENQVHHRGQTTVYLRLKGIKPPPEK